MTEERFVDVAVVARRLGVSKVSIRNWIRDGKITAVCLENGRYRIPHWELVSLLERKRKARSQIGKPTLYFSAL